MTVVYTRVLVEIVGEIGFILSEILAGPGEMLCAAGVPHPERLYGIVVVVAFSVLVQGGSVPLVVRLLQLPMSTTDPEPWTVGVRLRDEPHGVQRFTVASGSAADGMTVEHLGDNAGDIWVSIVVRASGLVPVRGDTELRGGDEVVILAEPELSTTLDELFCPET